MAVGATRGGWYWSDATERGEVRFASNPLGVSAGGDEELSGDDCTSAVDCQDLRVVRDEDTVHGSFEFFGPVSGVLTGSG